VKKPRGKKGTPKGVSRDVNSIGRGKKNSLLVLKKKGKHAVRDARTKKGRGERCSYSSVEGRIRFLSLCTNEGPSGQETGRRARGARGGEAKTLHQTRYVTI